MKKRSVILAGALAIGFAIGPAGVSEAAIPPQQEISICQNLFGGVFGSPNSEPFAPCQWDMAIMNAGTASYARATGQGVKVGVIDSGVQTNHPDIAPNLNLALSCSFLTPGTPTAAPGEIPGPAGCANKAAVEDLAGHGTHVASTIAAPVNGVGIAGVAPRATIVALKACTMAGFCFVDAVSAALRYAGDQRLDVVNLSLFADPFLFYCKSDAEQRAMLQQLESAARYAQQRDGRPAASADRRCQPGLAPGRRGHARGQEQLPGRAGRATRGADRFGHRAGRIPRLQPDHRRLFERGHVPGGRDRPRR
jgi:hypothetical protein